MMNPCQIQKKQNPSDTGYDGAVVAAVEQLQPPLTSRRRRGKREPLRISLLGCGAINSTVVKMILNGEAGPATLEAILVRNERSEEWIKESLLPEGHSFAEAATTTNTNSASLRKKFTTDPDIFFSADWDLCIEAAGQPAVKQYGKRCLEMGRDLMITSIGSLTDDALYADLSTTAEACGSRLILCTGSMPAIDWMGSAAILRGDDDDDRPEVRVTQIKPPRAWLGTTAEKEHADLLSLKEPRLLFEGSSRDAASTYPKNANVAAMLALATAGLDSTQTSLVADPGATSNRVELSFRGAAGKIQVQVEAAPSKTNPRTSAIVALSVVKAIRKLCSPVVVGL